MAGQIHITGGDMESHVSELPIQLRDNLAYILGDGLSIDEKFPILSLDYTIELAVGAIILEYVD